MTNKFCLKFHIKNIFSEVQCGDSITKENYSAKYADFKMRNNRDAHMDASIDTEIPGFVERIAVTSDENGKVPEWMTTIRFTWFTVLLMTWPYRWMFNHKTGKTTYNIKKSIFVNPPFQNPFPNTNPGTSGWTESQPSISSPKTKLGLYHTEKYVQYDFDTYNDLHVS